MDARRGWLHRTTLVVLGLASGACGGMVVSSSRGAEQDVLEAEHGWVVVTLAHDADAFASYLDDQWVGLSDDGRWIEKGPWTESLRAGTTHYDAVELSNLRVRFPRPDLAVVTGDFMQKGHSGARDNGMTGRYVDTWARIGQRWQLVSSGFAPLRDPESDAARVEALERAWVDAAIRGDADAFARYMTDDYVAVSDKGPLTRSEWVERLRSRRSTFSTVEFQNVSVRVHGDAAVFMADFDQVATANGVDNSVRGTETTTWVRDGGTWRVVASSFSRVRAR